MKIRLSADKAGEDQWTIKAPIQGGKRANHLPKKKTG
jgi:hypothetical protein